jgi:hypothetical protein
MIFLWYEHDSTTTTTKRMLHEWGTNTHMHNESDCVRESSKQDVSCQITSNHQEKHKHTHTNTHTQTHTHTHHTVTHPPPRRL